MRAIVILSPSKILDKYLKILLLLCILCFASCDKESNKTFLQSRISKLLQNAKTEKTDSLALKYIDSAYITLTERPNDTATRHYFRDVSAQYYNLGYYDKAISSSRKLYNLSQEQRDSSNMARALYISADALYGKQNKDSAFLVYSQSEKIYNKINDIGRLGEVVLYKAYIYYDIGEYELCENEAIKALKLLQSESKEQDVYYCYNLIALALDGQGNNTEALKYYQKTLEQLETLRQKGTSDELIESNKASCYNNMGGVYVKMNQHKKAISLYKEALAYEELEKSNPSLYAKLLNNLAYARFKSGNTFGLPDLFFKSLNVRKKINNESGIVGSYLYLGEYYAANNDTLKALEYLKLAYDDSNKIKSYAEVLESLKLLSEIDKKNSSFYSTKYIEVNKKLADASKKVKNRFARIVYETDRLEVEKEELLKKNSFIIGASAIALLFIAAIFAIYYLNSRNKKLVLIQQQQKANEEIYQLMFDQQSKVDSARREEKNRIAMELHDGILNNIYAVRLNLEFINKKSDEESIQQRKDYIKELQKVETEIRGVSHDLSRNAIFNGDKSFSNLLEEMVKSQKNAFNTAFSITTDHSINWDEINNVIKVNAYRIIQESIQNINKYSEATQADIQIKKAGNRIIIKISDNGKGFDPDKAKGGIGLKNLKKRAADMDASLTITSQPGQGTSVELTFAV